MFSTCPKKCFEDIEKLLLRQLRTAQNIELDQRSITKKKEY